MSDDTKPLMVNVTIVSAEGVFPGVLTSDEHGDLVTTSGYCEDYPCCGHEAGDCFGQKYGSDQSIKEAALERMRMEDEGYFFDDESDR